jgi:protein TonB
MTAQAVTLTDETPRKARRFGFGHGLATSILLHLALLILYVAAIQFSPDEENETLVFELDGQIADSQEDEKLQQDTIGAAPQDAVAAAAAPARTSTEAEQATTERPAETAAKDAVPVAQTATQAPRPAVAASPGLADVAGETERQQARAIRRETDPEVEAIRRYVQKLSKKIQSRLVYPSEARDAGLQGSATVAFVISASGQLRSETLRIVVGSGKPLLDAGALKTVRAASPFAPPPREMTVAVDVDFSRKR